MSTERLTDRDNGRRTAFKQRFKMYTKKKSIRFK